MGPSSMTTVLVTSVGRQSELITAFRSALRGRGALLGADLDEDAAGLKAGDVALVSPPRTSAEFVPWVLDTCGRRGVSLIVPLHEGDLEILDDARASLDATGVVLLGSSSLPAMTYADKFILARQLADHGIPAPPTFLADEVIQGTVVLEGPIIIKARRGRASEGLARLESPEMLPDILRGRPHDAFVVQREVRGEEYGMDIVNDLGGEFAAVLVRRKLRMRCGETDRAETVDAEPFLSIGALVSGFTGHLGPFDIDLIAGKEGHVVLDINPRFGGGYIFNHVAGSDVPAAILGWLRGSVEAVRHLEYRAGVRSQRITSVIPLESSAVEMVPDVRRGL